MQSAPFHSSFNGNILINEALDQIVISNSSNQKIITLGKQANGLFSLLFNNGSNNVMLVGQDSTGAYVVKIGKNGQDPVTAPDSELIFNSNQDTFKIATIVTYNFNFTASGYLAGTQYTVPHNLGYVPLIQGFATLTSAPGATGNYPLPYIYTVTQTPTIPAAFLIGGIINVQGVDDNNIYVGVGLGSSGETIAGTLKFYVLQETAS